MNGYERIMNTIKGEDVDRTSVWAFVMAFSAKYANIPYSQFASNYKKLVEAQSKTVEAFDLDAIPVDSDAYREASACGAVLEYPEDDLPIIKVPAIQKKEEFNFKIPDISTSLRLVDKIEGVRRLKEIYNKEKAIVGWIEAPLQSASTIYDLNNLMMDFYCDTNFVTELLDFSMELGVQFAKEQVKAGADIIGIGDAVATMVSPELYEKYVLPYTRKLVEKIRNSVDCILKYHVCGDSNHLLPYIKEIGFDIVNVDYKVDMKKAFETLENISTVKGNVDPVNCLLKGNEKIIKEEVDKILVIKKGNFILSPGCEVPKNTPHENLHALVNSIK